MIALVVVVVLPLVAGLGCWVVGDALPRWRSVLAALGLVATFVASLIATITSASFSVRWGAGVSLVFEVDPIARAPMVLVPVVAAAVVIYAMGYGDDVGRARMVGLLVAFVGAMELLLISADLISLLVGWELVALVSWGLIAHHWRDDGPANAAHAYLVTRVGDLGLFLAAGAAFAATGSIRFADLASVTSSGGWPAHALVAGVLLAVLTKSAQLPFSPWLFSAMAGPTPASALLHSATMVAAGAYLLARLSSPLALVGWFAPVAIGAGLATALAGGVVAAVQPDAKKLLAASTSAHYGFMIVAVGAGYPAVAIAHLVAHGLFKASLFISAGVAIDASGTERLADMDPDRSPRTIAMLTALSALALAAVPPLGAAWTKEQVIGAATHHAVWIGLAVVVAGGFSAFYATRFQLLAFGTPRRWSRDGSPPRRFGHALVALAGLAVGTVGMSLLWLPVGRTWLIDVTGGALPPSRVWELVVSLLAVGLGIAAAAALRQRHRLTAPRLGVAVASSVSDWFGIPRATRTVLVDPVLALADRAAAFDDRVVDAGVRAVSGGTAGVGVRLARFDDRIVDAGVRAVASFTAAGARLLDRIAEVGVDGIVGGIAAGTGAVGRRIRRVQSGQVHEYYALIVGTTVLLVVLLFVWS